MTVSSARNSDGKLVSLRWIVRDITIQKQAQSLVSSLDLDVSQGRKKYVYFKGDIIPLDPEDVWLVHHRLVKLSTMNERAEEVLVGLASSSMPFGSTLTDLPAYEAIAPTQNVELVNISRSEIAVSPRLAIALLPKITQRLRQTEALLAISGKRQVKDRLDHLLLFLKEKFGQTLPQCIRLSIRLTHQDFADACCTTRATITRLMGKLQKQGKIQFDSQNRIIFTDVWHEKYPNAG